MMKINETITNVMHANANARAKKEAEKNTKIAACGGLAATAVTAVVGFFRVRSIKKKYLCLADALDSVNARLNIAEAKLSGIEGRTDVSNSQEDLNSEPAENNNGQEEK